MLRYQPDLPNDAFAVGRQDARIERAAVRARHEPEPARLAADHAAAPASPERATWRMPRSSSTMAPTCMRATRTFCSTPLGWAAKFGKTRMVELLLRRGAKPNLPDDPPWATPLAWATRRGHDRIARTLKQYEEEGALRARPAGAV